MVMMARPSATAVAYFSMEVGIDASIPTYAGGLGVLAGDTLRAAADLGVEMVGVTLLYHEGYFRQHLDSKGRQAESPVAWHPEDLLEPLSERVTITIEGRPVMIRAWRYIVKGISGNTLPIIFLDTQLPNNSPWDRALTDHLYGGDEVYRLAQEIVLGVGGIAMLRALGYRNIQAYHMNEGHSAFLALALLAERVRCKEHCFLAEDDIEAVRWQCVFTTHTPVPEGHDQFPIALVRRMLGEDLTRLLEESHCLLNGTLNMTHLGLFFSRYINGVSMRHEEISRGMYPQYPINSITNGVHALTWTSLPFRRLFDFHMPEWRRDNLYLRYAISIPVKEIRQAHTEAKERLLAEVKRRTGVILDPQVLTLGFARRAAPYKRADFFFYDLKRIENMVKTYGPLQLIYGGKAHPRDAGGKAIIQRVFEAAEELRGIVPVVYLEDYDMDVAKFLCAGVDLWVNTPLKPREASGTSGMKAALNGVPSLSVLDGWWIEGHIEGVTGWSIGEGWEPESDPIKEIGSLYEKLERAIMPLYYDRPDDYAAVMRSVIAFNGSYFNAQRMMRQYLHNAYLKTVLP